MGVICFSLTFTDWVQLWEMCCDRSPTSPVNWQQKKGHQRLIGLIYSDRVMEWKTLYRVFPWFLVFFIPDCILTTCIKRFYIFKAITTHNTTSHECYFDDVSLNAGYTAGSFSVLIQASLVKWTYCCQLVMNKLDKSDLLIANPTFCTEGVEQFDPSSDIWPHCVHIALHYNPGWQLLAKENNNRTKRS